MITKVIHYCWFGRGKMSALEKRCLESWKEHCPDFEIKEWNEGNFDIAFCEFTKEAYRLKKYAFVSDVARLYALHQEGGIYLDTDMLLIDSLNSVLATDFFIGKENEKSLNGAIIGAIRGHSYLKALIGVYQDNKFELGGKITIPMVLNECLLTNRELRVYSSEVFYPVPFNRKHENHQKFIKDNTIGIHLWSHSWKDKYTYLRERKYIKAFKSFLKEDVFRLREYSFLGVFFIRTIKSAWVKINW